MAALSQRFGCSQLHSMKVATGEQPNTISSLEGVKGMNSLLRHATFDPQKLQSTTLDKIESVCPSKVNLVVDLGCLGAAAVSISSSGF